MDHRNLENKAETKPTKVKESRQLKQNDDYIVIKAFCGIEIGTIKTIRDKSQAEYMLKNGYVKKQD